MQSNRSLPPPQTLARTLARHGVTPDTEVIAYDDSRFAFGARLWWLMDSLGYRPPRLLNGGYAGFLRAGGKPSTAIENAVACAVPTLDDYRQLCDFQSLPRAQAPPGGAEDPPPSQAATQLLQNINTGTRLRAADNTDTQVASWPVAGHGGAGFKCLLISNSTCCFYHIIAHSSHPFGLHITHYMPSILKASNSLANARFWK